MYANRSPGGGEGNPAMVAITTFLLAAMFIIVSAGLGSWTGADSTSTNIAPAGEAGIPVTGGNADPALADSGQPDLQSGTGGTSEFSTYLVQHGDTLGEIAARYGTTMAQILLHNPQIQDPDLVRPGDTLNLPSGLSVPVTSSPALITIAPASGPPGMAVSIYGHGFLPNGLFSLSAGATGSQPAFSQPLTANQFGAIAAQVVIPSGAVPGDVWLFQISGSPEGLSPSTTYQVTHPGPETITVQPGDRLGEIVARHGVTLRDMLIANPGILDPRGIVPGVVLTIPPITPPEPPIIPDTGQESAATYTVQPGDTLGEIASRFGTTVDQILALNREIQDPDRIFPGWVLALP